MIGIVRAELRGGVSDLDAEALAHAGSPPSKVGIAGHPAAQENARGPRTADRRLDLRDQDVDEGRLEARADVGDEALARTARRPVRVTFEDRASPLS